MASILLSESLTSINPGESLYITQDIVRILYCLGARAVFATHLHELAADVETLNTSADGDGHIVSLVASWIGAEEDEPRRSYKIAPGLPLGHGYAREIAAQYGRARKRVQ